jgi:hypothetical protein
MRMDYGDIYQLLIINNFRSNTTCTAVTKCKRKTVAVSHEALVMTKVQIRPLFYMTLSIYVTLQNCGSNGFCQYNTVHDMCHTLSILVSLYFTYTIV